MIINLINHVERRNIMSKRIRQHIAREYRDWEKIQQAELDKLHNASRHLWINVCAYLTISIIEYFLSILSSSQTLRADAFNNLSGIISTTLLLVGIHIAKDIDDQDIVGAPLPKLSLKHTGNDQRVQFTRFRYETIFTLTTSIIMCVIALQIIVSGVVALMDPKKHVIPEPSALLGAGIASCIMLGVWCLNKRNGHRLQNAALIAAAQDSLSDALTSIGTLISIGGALFFQISWLDGAMSILVGLFILYSGLRIFFESSLNLADYFDPEAEAQFRDVIAALPDVKHVNELKAHYSGNMVTLDAVITVDANMNVLESYHLSEHIENLMRYHFGIIDTDISFIPDEDTITKETLRRTHRNKERLLRKQGQINITKNES